MAAAEPKRELGRISPGTREIGRIVDVDSPSSFHVILEKDREIWEQLANGLINISTFGVSQDYLHSNIGSKIGVWIRDRSTATSDGSGHLERFQIYGLEQRQFKFFLQGVFVDSGKEEEFVLTDDFALHFLAPIPDDLAAMPRVAVACGLRAIKDSPELLGSAQDVEIFKYILKAVSDRNSGMYIQAASESTDPLAPVLVDIFDYSGRDIWEAMKEMVFWPGSAQLNDQSVPVSSSVSLLSTVASIDDHPDVMCLLGAPEKQPPPSERAYNLFPRELIEQERKRSVRLTEVRSPNCFYLLINAPVIRELLSQLQANIRRSCQKGMTIFNINKGAGLVAVNPVSGQFERGQSILHRPATGEIDVFFVDRGNEAPIKPEHVMMIHGEDMRLPKMAIRCSLKDVQPVSNSEEYSIAATKFLADLGSVDLECYFHEQKDETYEVELFNFNVSPGYPVSVMEAMNRKGLVAYKSTPLSPMYNDTTTDTSRSDEDLHSVQATDGVVTEIPVDATVKYLNISQCEGNRKQEEDPKGCMEQKEAAIDIATFKPQEATVETRKPDLYLSPGPIETAGQQQQMKSALGKPEPAYLEPDNAGRLAMITDAQGNLDVYVSFIEDLDTIYVQTVRDADKLIKLQAALQSDVSRSKKEKFDSPPSAEQLCAAKFTEDHQWYRAQVIESSPFSDNCKVRFVDYGNIGNDIPRDDVIILDEYLQQDPPYAYSVKLADAPSHVELVEQLLITGSPIRMKLIEKKAGRMEVAFFEKQADGTLRNVLGPKPTEHLEEVSPEMIDTPELLSVNKAVDCVPLQRTTINQTSAVPMDNPKESPEKEDFKNDSGLTESPPTNIPLNSRESEETTVPDKLTEERSNSRDSGVILASGEDQQRMKPWRRVVSKWPGEPLEAEVTHTESPFLFYIALFKYTKEYGIVQEGVAAAFSSAAPLIDPGPGTPCMAEFQGEPYRACVGELDGESKFVVDFVDFGNKETKEKGEIFQIPAELAEILKMVIPCTLAGVGPVGGSWSESATEKFKQMIEPGTAGLRFTFETGDDGEGVCPVSVTVNETSVANILVEAQLAKRPYFTGGTVKPQIDATEEVLVTRVSKRSTLYASLMKNDDIFGQMEEIMLEEWPKRKVLSPLKKGMACMVMTNKDGVPTRGEVEEVTEKVVSVFDVDLGVKYDVGKHGVFWLRSELLEIPKQVLVCVEAQVDKAKKKEDNGWPVAIKEKLCDWLGTQRVTMKFLKQRSDGVYKVAAFVDDEEMYKVLTGQGEGESSPPL